MEEVEKGERRDMRIWWSGVGVRKHDCVALYEMFKRPEVAGHLLTPAPSPASQKSFPAPPGVIPALSQEVSFVSCEQASYGAEGKVCAGLSWPHRTKIWGVLLVLLANVSTVLSRLVCS